MAAPSTENPVPVAFVLDFETGDTKCDKGACTQIAIHAIRLDTFEKMDSYVKYIYPYNQKEIKGVTKKKKVLKNKHDIQEEVLMDYKQEALEYSAITMDMLYSMGEDIQQVAEGVIQFFKDNTFPKTPKSMMPIIIGQNIGFDNGFLQQMMEYTGLAGELKKCLRGHIDFYGNFQPVVIDTIVLGQLALCHLPNIDSYKLEILCENLGIELDDAHDADADVTATANVVNVITSRMRSTGGETSTLSLSKSEKSRKHFKI